jgi:glutaredoxin
MIFLSPNSKGFTVYTKKDCHYCNITKELLNTHFELADFIPCDDYLVNNECKQLFIKFMNSLTKDKFKTFPVVFYNGDFIGGCKETGLFLQN